MGRGSGRIVYGVVLVGLLLLAIAPAAGAKSRVVSPKSGKFVKRSPAKVVVRTSPGPFHVRRGRRNVTGAFSGGGTRHVARLRMRPGVNHVYARSGGDFDYSRFVVARRRSGAMLDLGTIRTGGPTAPLKVKAAHSHKHTLRARLNGQPVASSFVHHRGKRRLARLGADDGVRFGRNTLRLLVFNDRGRYDVETSSFTVPRSRPLAGAGSDRTTRAGGRVRLNGHRSRLAGARKPSFRWRIVRSPDTAGSSSRRGADPLRRARTQRPILRPRAPGAYLVRLTVRGDGAAASDTVRVLVDPGDSPIGAPIKTIADPRGTITIDGKPVPGTGAGGNTISYALLDRTTRQPPEPPACRTTIPFTGSVDRSSGGIGTLQQLADKCKSPGYLLALSAVRGIDPAALGAFEGLVSSIGGAPLSDADRSAITACPVSVIGIPTAPAGSAFTGFHRRADDAGCGSGALNGFLQVNTATEQYGFAFGDPVRFDTRASHSASSNAIRIGGTTYEGELGPGQTAGLHFVAVDPVSLAVLIDRSDPAVCELDPEECEVNEAFPTNSGNPVQDQKDVEVAAAEIRRWAVEQGGLVFIQSIGNPHPTGAAWNRLADAITAAGGTRTVLNQLDGKGGYALVGCGRVASPSEISEPLTGQRPSLNGILGRARSSAYEPTVSDPVAVVNQELPSLVYQPATPFPRFDEGQQGANRYIARELFGEAILPADMRQLYWIKFGTTSAGEWGSLRARLATMAWPGRAKCGCSKADWDTGQGGGAKPQILKELDAVRVVRGWVDNLQKTIDPTQSAFDLARIGSDIERAVDPSGNVEADPFDLIGSMLSIAGNLPGDAGAAASVTASLLGLIAGPQSGGTGSPLLGEIDAKVSDLTHQLFVRFQLVKSAVLGAGLILVSDYGKLISAATKINSDPKWQFPAGGDLTPVQTRVNKGAKAWFYSELMPTAWIQWQLPGAANARDYGCKVAQQGYPEGRTVKPFNAEPDSGQYLAAPSVGADGKPATALRGLGLRTTFDPKSLTNGSASPPSAGLTDPLFKPPDPDVGSDNLGLHPQVFYERVFEHRTASASSGQFC